MQYLKRETQERLISAALLVFSQEGFPGATMAEIGKRAGISTGNIYRYFGNKESLFEKAIPHEFAKRFLDLACKKAESLAGVKNIHNVKAGMPYFFLSEQLLAFCVEHRLRIVILLNKSRGTPYEDFADQVVKRLSSIAIGHFRALQPDLRVTEIMRFNLQQIYRNSIRAIVNILRHFDDEVTIRQAIEGYTRFHLSGLKEFFQ
jgi:AcrR family transcriptional regulator